MKERRFLTAPRTAGILVIVIVIGCLLAGEPLRSSAEDVQSPALRALAVTAARPLASVSQRLHLNEARRWVLARFGADEMVATRESAPGQRSSAELGPAVSSPAESVPATSTTVAPPGSTVTSPSSTTSGPTVSSNRAKPRVTAARPIRVLVAGDSLILQVGHAVARLSQRLPIEVKVMSKPSSGLSRPDFYDWPAVLAKTLGDFKPDVTVVMFGNNDKQNVIVDGERLERFTPEWWEMYNARIQAVLDLLKGAGSRPVWVGMPIMRGAKYAETARSFNAAYVKACKRAGVPFVDSYRLLSGDDGQYTAYLPNAAGKSVLMRNSDGIHLTEAGGDLVAGAIAKVLRQYFDFE